jgi:hypothetical protein
VLLRETGSARASELAERLKKNPGRLNGLMVSLRRTLHAEGHVSSAMRCCRAARPCTATKPKEGR